MAWDYWLCECALGVGVRWGSSDLNLTPFTKVNCKQLLKKKTTKLKAKQNYNQKILEENTEELQRSLKEDSKTKTKENNDKYDHYQNFIFLKKKIQLTTPM